MQRFSILQPSLDCCYICGTNQNIHIHEIFYGTANRKLSIKYGLCVALCAFHHNMSNEGVHFNKELDNKLKAAGQKVFETYYPDKDFLQVFGKNYL